MFDDDFGRQPTLAAYADSADRGLREEAARERNARATHLGNLGVQLMDVEQRIVGEPLVPLDEYIGMSLDEQAACVLDRIQRVGDAVDVMREEFVRKEDLEAAAGDAADPDLGPSFGYDHGHLETGWEVY